MEQNLTDSKITSFLSNNKEELFAHKMYYQLNKIYVEESTSEPIAGPSYQTPLQTTTQVNVRDSVIKETASYITEEPSPAKRSRTEKTTSKSNLPLAVVRPRSIAETENYYSQEDKESQTLQEEPLDLSKPTDDEVLNFASVVPQVSAFSTARDSNPINKKVHNTSEALPPMPQLIPIS